MVQKKLNIKTIEAKLNILGLSQAKVADKLDVSRETVSQWFKGTKFPRPAKLLELSRLLKSSFNEVVIQLDDPNEPIIAFRKKGRHIISQEYIEEAKDKALLLQQLVPYLPFDNLSKPPSLISPQLDYEYIQKASNSVRSEIQKDSKSKVKFEDLINFFIKHHAVIIPVFWGNKSNHENALHIYLPQSMTTWIYLNLDSKIHDFKFWMAHELGHVKSPELQGDIAEDFADSFAGALLINQEIAEAEYLYLTSLGSKAYQVNRIKELAEEITVAPLTIYLEVNKFAEYTNKPKIDLETDKEIYKANAFLNKKYKSVSESIFETIPPSPKEYILSAMECFESPFFNTLKEFIIKNKKSVGFLQSILSLSPVDTHNLYENILK